MSDTFSIFLNGCLFRSASPGGMDIVGCITLFCLVLCPFVFSFSFICGLVLQGWSKESKSNGVSCWAMTTNSMMSRVKQGGYLVYHSAR